MNNITLPRPQLSRWQPLRLGLVDIFHYDSEEFHFRDGRLLLRGNNGTGKSKVLSLTLPFLFDAQLKSSRIEPDGDPGKKMAWNLLLGKHDRRTGYVWIEFGRRGTGNQEHFVTLGCGLSAVASRPQVDSWYFVADDVRIGSEIRLINSQDVVLTRDRLQEMLAGRGQVFPTAETYRRAVDERLFRLGSTRYAALMDTLIQLRQPQLSRRPDESSLSNALTEALAPLPSDLLNDVADAMIHLEGYRQEMEGYVSLEKAVCQFNQRYRIFAGTRARREARRLLVSQTEFEKAAQALNSAITDLHAAKSEERQHHLRQDEVEGSLRCQRASLKEMEADPVMRDARRLDDAKKFAENRRNEAAQANKARIEADDKLSRETSLTKQRVAQADEVLHTFTKSCEVAAVSARICGMSADYDREVAHSGDGRSVSRQDAASWHETQQRMQNLVARRQQHLNVLRGRLENVEDFLRKKNMAQEQCNASAEAFECANVRRTQSDAAVERHGSDLVAAWQRHFDGLKQLHPPDPDEVLLTLSHWVVDPTGDSPARNALFIAQQQVSERFANCTSAHNQRDKELTSERKDLQAEQRHLEQGKGAAPPATVYRDLSARQNRIGAPLWQMLDFREGVPESKRAGLEAALEASGLLDAWVAPSGVLQTTDGTPYLDNTLVARQHQTVSLAGWLTPIGSTLVSDTIIAALLESIVCADADPLHSEAWVAPDGRFRIGPLVGAYTKPVAIYIGYAARTAARQKRIKEITQRVAEIDLALDIVARDRKELEQQRKQAAAEWSTAPSDDSLRATHVEVTAAARALAIAEQALQKARMNLEQAEQRWREAHASFIADAADLLLPADKAGLIASDVALNEFKDLMQRIFLAAQDLRHILSGLDEQRRREAEAAEYAASCRTYSVEQQNQSESAQVVWQTLFETVGMKIEDLLKRLETARKELEQNEKVQLQIAEKLRIAGEARAKAEQKQDNCTAAFESQKVMRQKEVAMLQNFAASGLLLVAMSNIEHADLTTPWTIESALVLARHVERALIEIKAEDSDWNRIQNRISEDFNELVRSLSALGQQVHGTSTDYGLVVSVVYRNRDESPVRLESLLAQEIAQRRELLTANERTLLENHLQAEVASVIQQLFRAAEQRLAGINAELEKRPTSTGVRFRLVWEALAEGDGGAPIGLESARKKLLNTSADAWSAEDRRAVGEMLQNRIISERARNDIDGGDSLLEQLSRALDYRRWHRFRVERWQEGRWGRLSGPASSGERALGLTVPLFAAVASHYSQGVYHDAPRLVLLDEAFAGIDREARAHCMALIREFDLDFVMTSESEWGCYAELPGLSICHLLRREGIDAVHVSRWAWDGRTRRAEPNPDRQFFVDA